MKKWFDLCKFSQLYMIGGLASATVMMLSATVMMYRYSEMLRLLPLAFGLVDNAVYLTVMTVIVGFASNAAVKLEGESGT